ncbi:MAG: leucine-rich repeat domain-containing protein, partial [Prevotella sp.]|nr:leucine-rich repeat domain-containing protein [Prevotella sp.]
AFSGCSSLTSLDIPSSVTSIGGRAFSGCSSLTSLDIPSSVTSIGSDAFSGCSSLTSLEIPSSITSIGDYTFRNFSSLTSLKIPSSVTSIGNCAFDGCSSLTSLDIPSSVTSIGYSAFNNCRGLTSLEIPSSVTSIGDNAFDGCTSLVSVVMPNNVKIIGVGVFAHCSSLKHITIPSSINFIAPFLFWGCSSLENIEIPASVECIWGGAFYQCVNLKSIICNPLKAPAFRDPKQNISGGECICEPTLASQITLVTSKGAVGYAEAPWSYFKAPEALRLTDENVTVSPGAYPIGALTYNRSNMKPGSYATFCLPFDTNLSEVSDAFENVYTANQTALYKPDGKLILLLQKIDTDASISAGQPFVAKLKDNVTDVTFSNNKLMTVDSDIMQNGTPTPLRVFDWDGTSGLLTENTDIKVSYGGALSTMTGVGSEYETFNSNGTFGPTKGGQVKAFRAYVLKEDAVTQGRVKSISLGIEGNDGTTNIETIVDSPEKNTDKMVYSIDGRLVNTTGSVVGLPSGIYIKNHQKIYVK